MSTRRFKGREIVNNKSHGDVITSRSNHCCLFFCSVCCCTHSRRFCQRNDEFPLYSRRPSCDTLALAMCDPGLRRRHSSECEEDSLPEVYMDSGLSTLRGSHTGYDSEQEISKIQEDEAEEEEERTKARRGVNSHNSTIGENWDTEVRRRFPGTRGSWSIPQLDTWITASTVYYQGPEVRSKKGRRDLAPMTRSSVLFCWVLESCRPPRICKMTIKCTPIDRPHWWIAVVI